jgi:hypothetical protein
MLCCPAYFSFSSIVGDSSDAMSPMSKLTEADLKFLFQI